MSSCENLVTMAVNPYTSVALDSLIHFLAVYPAHAITLKLLLLGTGSQRTLAGAACTQRMIVSRFVFRARCTSTLVANQLVALAEGAHKVLPASSPSGTKEISACWKS